MLPLRVLFGVALALDTPDCEVGFGYERRGKPSSTSINSFKACQATCSDHSQCAHFTYDYKTQECWLLGGEASLEAEVSSISGAIECRMPTFNRLTETEEQRDRRIHRMIATMAGNVAKRSKDELVIGVAKHMEYAARSGYLAEEKYDHVVVILNAAIADMDSGSIGRVTSYGHLVPTRDDLDWLLAHMEGIKGIPPRAEEMNQGDAHTFDSKAGAYSAGGPWTNAQVKYCYDQYLSLSAKIALDCAMGKVRQELPGIEFINVGYKGPDACNTHPAIYIQSSNTGCWADIGMSIEDFTGNQKLNLGVPGCTDCGTAIHELLHSMGMAHEQSRPDRDTFVEIKWDNIMSSMYSQFAKDPHADTSVDYDIMSIMHDGRFHWSNNEKETIVVKEAGYRLYTDDPGQHHIYAIGQHIMMTQNDVRQLAKMYNCTSNTICGTGRTDVRNVNNGAPSASIKGQTDIFHGYQSVSYVTAAAFSLVASSLACCCFCSFSISQSKNEDSRSLLREP